MLKWAPVISRSVATALFRDLVSALSTSFASSRTRRVSLAIAIFAEYVNSSVINERITAQFVTTIRGSLLVRCLWYAHESEKQTVDVTESRFLSLVGWLASSCRMIWEGTTLRWLVVMVRQSFRDDPVYSASVIFLTAFSTRTVGSMAANQLTKPVAGAHLIIVGVALLGAYTYIRYRSVETTVSDS